MPRRRSIFEPIPSFPLVESVNNDPERVARRLGRFHRALQQQWQSVQQQIGAATTNPFLAWKGLHNDIYAETMTDSLTIKMFRVFGLNSDSDRRYFFERTGRESHVIHRARVFLRRRFVEVYAMLRQLFPRETVFNILNSYRASLPDGHTLRQLRIDTPAGPQRHGSYLKPDRREFGLVILGKYIDIRIKDFIRRWPRLPET